MNGINLNRTITFLYSSLRYFGENEHHISRFCKDDVLLLVFDGILRFSENGEQMEVHPGEYYIQRKNMYQGGEITSDAPKYLYVHFHADWDSENDILPYRGHFDIGNLMPIMVELDRLSHNNGTLAEKQAAFFQILSMLYRRTEEPTIANRIANFISEHYLDEITLDMIAEEFNFSKNHVINIFKKEYDMTPFEYMNHLKIKQAESLLEITSRPVESICYECGFNHYSHFYKLFYRVHQMSPTDWRRKKRMMLI